MSPGATSQTPTSVSSPYRFDMKAKNSANLRVADIWVEVLPKVIRKFGHEKEYIYHYSVTVRSKGSMDESLFYTLHDDIVLRC